MLAESWTAMAVMPWDVWHVDIEDCFRMSKILTSPAMLFKVFFLKEFLFNNWIYHPLIKVPFPLFFGARWMPTTQAECSRQVRTRESWGAKRLSNRRTEPSPQPTANKNPSKQDFFRYFRFFLLLTFRVTRNASYACFRPSRNINNLQLLFPVPNADFERIAGSNQLLVFLFPWHDHTDWP